MKFTTNSDQKTIELGQKFGALFQGGEIVLLQGDLGAGKTHFTKGIAQGLGISETIVSPTFTIERIYQGRLELHHFDFYRLDNNDPELIEEVRDLAKDDKNVLVVEWPKNLQNAIPDESIIIHISYLTETEREISFTIPQKWGYLKESYDFNY